MNKPILKHVSNLRDLGGYKAKNGITKYNKIFRSNLPFFLTNEEKKYFDDLDLTVIDLRTREEIENKKNFFNSNKYKYYNVVLKGDKCPKKEKDIPDGYMEIIDDYNSIKNVFNIIKDSPGSVLYNCSSGKDRTGVVTMLILLLVGVGNDDIVFDYSISYRFIKDEIIKMHDANPKIPKYIGRSKSKYMKQTLKLFLDKYNNINDYMKILGFNDNEIKKIISKLV